jgi:hypothetical protein
VGGLLLWTGTALAYPLDGWEWTDNGRLEAYYRASKAGAKIIPRGARHTASDITLSLADQPHFELPAPDPGLTAEIEALVGADARAYSISVLDLTDTANPRYAELNPNMALQPASVGKICTALSLYQMLANVHPIDIEARKAVLRNTMVTANAFIRKDSHDVGFWSPGDPKVIWRPIVEGDTGNLYTYLDWMLSSSSSAAAAMVQREAMLMQEFGTEYPVSDARARAYFTNTPKSRLGKDLSRALVDPVRQNGLDAGKLRQGSFFTREGKSRVPGSGSTATSRELMRYLVRMEQGKLVDPFSSMELKRTLYLTQARIRYAASPALEDSMLYFKSGSLYSCQPEKGFTCTKFHGNRYNYMNSVAIVETPDHPVPLRYMVVIMSNVLRKNSSELHEQMGTRLHELMKAAHPG